MRRFTLAASVLSLMSISTLADDPKPGDAPDHKVVPKAADGDAPLAEGFPTGTKPGTIEVKRYPPTAAPLPKPRTPRSPRATSCSSRCSTTSSGTRSR